MHRASRTIRSGCRELYREAPESDRLNDILRLPIVTGAADRHSQSKKHMCCHLMLSGAVN